MPDSTFTYWRIVAASVRGTSHEKTGQPCQDAHHFFQRDDLLIAAVADGAGSASHAELGASLAAFQAVENVRCALMEPHSTRSEADWRSLLLTGMLHARDALEQKAEEQNISLRELATTLILLVAQPGSIAVLQCGDGAAVVQDAGGAMTALTTPQNGEYANETNFLTSPDAPETAQFALWQGNVARIALLTDGLQRLALQMPEGAPHTPFFNPLFRFAMDTQTEAEGGEQLAAFLRSPRITSRTDDDLTLLLAALV